MWEVVRHEQTNYGCCQSHFLDADRGEAASRPVVQSVPPCDTQGKDVGDDHRVFLATQSFSFQVPIKDECLSCESDRVDLSRPAFTMLENPAFKGRLDGAVYEIIECDGNTTALYAATNSDWTRFVALNL